MVTVDGAPAAAVVPVDPTGVVVSLVVDDGPAVPAEVVGASQGGALELVRTIDAGTRIAVATPSGLQTAFTADPGATIARIAGIIAGAPAVDAVAAADPRRRCRARYRRHARSASRGRARWAIGRVGATAVPIRNSRRVQWNHSPSRERRRCSRARADSDRRAKWGLGPDRRGNPRFLRRDHHGDLGPLSGDDHGRYSG